MRKLIFMMSISVDGFFEGPDRELDWQLVDEELHQHFNDELREMSVFIGGRVTHELMVGYWPTADEDQASSAPEREFASIWRDTPKVVYSRTLTHADWNTTVEREVVPEAIASLKAQPGGDMLLGGADLGETFARLGLIDEYRLYVHPVVLGEGRRLLPLADALVALHLAEARVFTSGVVLLRYEVR